MELMIEALKRLILDHYSDVLNEFRTKEVPLPMVLERNIVVGDIDLQKYRADTVMFILPDRTVWTELSINSELCEFEADIFIALQKSDRSSLHVAALRHMEAFKKMCLENPTIGSVEVRALSGEFIQGVEGSEEVKGVLIHVKESVELVF